MVNTKKLINAKQISKSYGSHLIFEDISLEVNRGEVVGIWGPNGSGKSSLLKVLARLEKFDPKGGYVKYSPEVNLGYKPQNAIHGLLPWHNNVRNLKILSGNHFKSDNKAVEVLSEHGFSREDIEKKPNELSGGYQQRLALICALMKQSNCLLLDEPFAGMDRISLIWTLGLIQDFINKNNAVLIVTHDPEAVILCSNRIIILKHVERCPTIIEEEFKVDLAKRDIMELTSEPVSKYRKKLLNLAYEEQRKQ